MSVVKLRIEFERALRYSAVAWHRTEPSDRPGFVLKGPKRAGLSGK